MALSTCHKQKNMATVEPLMIDDIAISGHANNPESPVVKAILFSRDFIPTYYLCLVVVVFLAASLRYATRLSRQRRPNQRREDSRVLTSRISSTSTLNDLVVQKKQIEGHNERTPLVGMPPCSVQGHSTMFRRCWAHARSVLLYQPRPIFALTAQSNKLPSHGTTFLILLLLAINLFYLFYQNVPVTTPTFAFANRTGLCFVANLPILYLLGAKNNKPLKWLTGWSYEGLNIVHRRLGEWMIILATIHVVGMLMVWYDMFRPLGHDIWWFLSLKIIALGLSAYISYILIYATSVGYFREAFYETFLATHIFLQAAALVLVFLHHHAARWYCGAALAIWMFDRLVTRILVSWKTLVGTLQIAPDGGTVLLFIDIPLTASKYGGIKCGWQAGQHVFIAVPGLGFSHRYQTHPFTIASPAPPANLQDLTWPLQLIIKGKDGFSKDLLDYARLHQHTKVVLDGPYGSVEVLDALRHADRTCLIAGGTGIAVTYPLSWTLSNNTQNVILSSRATYKSGRRNIPSFPIIPVDEDNEQHIHLWVRQKSAHREWITMFPALASGPAEPIMGQIPCETFAIDLIDRSFNTREASATRPDIELEICSWLRDRKLPSLSGDRICVVVSGPDELAREVRNVVSRLNREGFNIEIFVEKFGW